MKPKQIVHYCEACKTEHTFIQNQFPYWRVKKVDGKKLYYCNKGIDCAGCKEIHLRIGITKSYTDHSTGNTYWLCNKWFKKTGNGEIQWENWSPQDVMSGVHFGEARDPVYGKDTEDFSITHAEEVKALGEEFDKLEGY